MKPNEIPTYTLEDGAFHPPSYLTDFLGGLLKQPKASRRNPPFLMVKANGCWNWLSVATDGYGNSISLHGKTSKPYRLFFELFRGKIKPGFQVDHLCRNRACVNPNHLDSVTPRENTLRGISITSKNATKTHCKYGHEFDEKNTIRVGERGRRCRACDIIFKPKRNAISNENRRLRNLESKNRRPKGKK